jgi:hypothetical protein
MYILLEQIVFLFQVDYTCHLEYQVLSTMEWSHMNNVYGSHAHLFAFSPSGIHDSWNDLGEGVAIQSKNM